MIRSFSTLRIRLLLLVLLAVIPFTGLTLFTALEERKQESARIKQEALRVARLASSSQERLIESTHRLLIALAELPAVRKRDVAACSTLLAGMLEHYPSYANLSVFDPEGNLFCSAIPSTKPLNAADLPWFKRTVQSRGLAVGDYQIGRITGKAMLMLAYPVHDATGELLSVVTAPLHLDWLNQLAAKTRLPEGATFSVVDRNGTILVRYPNPEQWIGKPLPDVSALQPILNEREGTMEANGVDGIPRLYAFTPLGEPLETGAYVRVGIPAETAYAEANRVLLRNLAVIGIITLLVLAATRFISSLLIMGPVKALVRATEKLAEGDLSARTGLPDGYGEFGHLAQAFDEMAGALERMEEERKNMEREFRQAQKMEAIGTLAGGIAHDFNNILAAVIGYTDMALCDVPQRSPLRDNLEEVLRAGHRARDLMNRILAFSRMKTHRLRTAVALGPIVENVLGTIEDSIPATIQVCRIIAADKAMVLADPVQLRQVLDDLCTNGVDAMRYKGGVLDVSLTEVELNGDSAILRSDLEPGPYIRLSVTDTGHGMDQTMMEHIFDPYFTTKGMSEGSGLGLAVARGIVRDHGGAIVVSSVPGMGSSFHVFLPRIKV